MIKIPLNNALSNIVVKQIRYKIMYHFTDVDDFFYESSPSHIALVMKAPVTAEREALITEGVTNMLRDLALVNRKFRGDLSLKKNTPERDGGSSNKGQKNGRELFAKDTISDGSGHVLYKGFALELIQTLSNFVDHIFAHVADEEIRVPSSISLAKLNRLDYVSTFHHHLCFVSHLDPGLENVSSFPEKWSKRGTDEVPQELYQSCALPGRALNPAVCLHVYPEFEAGKRKIPETGAWIRASGKVFRFESGNHSSMERLFEFTMHELVCIGPLALVTESGQKLHDLIFHLAQALKLESETVIANDMFISKTDETRIFSQVSTQSKVELIARLTPEDRTLAVASLNLHGQHFTKPLEIHTGLSGENHGSHATSLCLGIGIERLAYALASQHGYDALSVIKAANAEDIVKKSGF